MPKREHFEQCLSAFLAIGLTFALMAPATAADAPKVATYQQAAGPRYFAMSVSLDEEPVATPSEVVVLIDTSASQAAAFRNDSIATAKAILKALPADCQVQVLAGDLYGIHLTKSFVAPQSAEADAAIAELEKRTPLGATDLAALVDDSIASFSKNQKLNRSIVYIGDGSSRANYLSTNEFSALVAELRDNKVAFNSLAIGPQRDVEVLATLANQSGGMVLVDNNEVTPEEVGVRLAAIASTEVVWPVSAKYSANVAEAYPKQFPPMRADRDTIVVGVLEENAPTGSPVSVDLKASGAFAKTWVAKPEESSDDHAYLPQLMEIARKDDGLMLPTVGSAGLRETASFLMASAEEYARLGSQALAIGDKEGAARLAKAALEIDPNHPRAQSIVEAAKKTDTEEKKTDEKPPVDRGASARQIPVHFVAYQADEASDDASAPLTLGGSDDGAFLRESDLNRARTEQVIVAEITEQLRQANEDMGSNPEGVSNALKLLLDQLERAPDLSGDIRARLRNQIVASLRKAQGLTVVVESRRNAAAEREAIARERQALTEKLIRDEDRARVIMEMFDALMDEGKYVEARDAAITVRAMDPNNQAAVAGYQNAEIVGTYRETMALREQRYNRYIATLMQSEISSVPFPDEPPIVYPDADFWEEIYYRKEKYGSVDLASTGTAEQKIFQQLDAETKIQFIDTPLEEVVGYLKTLHGIEIQIDNRALEDMGLTSDMPVTRNIEGISLRSALRLMLKELELTYIVANEVLMITTQDEADAELITKVYPVADLVLPVSARVGTMGGGGMGGGMGGGGMGGMGGGGMGGMGGGMNGGGGGVFAVADEKSVAKIDEVEAAKVAADEPATEEAKSQYVLEVKEGETRPQAWVRAFESGEDVPAAAVRSEVRRCMATKRYSDAADLIQVALRHGQIQPWMYEAMGLALELNHSPKPEIERALMSAIDFSSGPNHMLVIADLMSRMNIDARALKIYQDVSQMEPLRPEPYALGLKVAQQLDDEDAIRWACVGILSQEWPKDSSGIRDEAYRTAVALLRQMVADERVKDAKTFDSQIRDALVRDAIVKVTWSGESDLDLIVEEPSGSVCSQHNPRTISGGVFLGDAASSLGDAGTEGAYELYVVPKGFKGDYKMLVRKVWGDVTAGKITVDVFTNYGTENQHHERQQLELGKDGAFITFNVPEGRRTESLSEQQVKVAVETQVAMTREIVARKLEQISESSYAAEEYVSDVNNNSNDFVRRVRNSVGYRPVITTLPEGANFSAFAVVSADRRYVRFNGTPLFSSIGEVTSYTFSGTNTGNNGTTGGNTGIGGGLGGGVGGGGGIF
ncbi:hypothetical protein DTL21_26235 [Bremerella cremea]|uniref:VWFA domain-containing protein n=1 Tax=Blastopirellula marina TaxID=124 RepID=A0A2S8FBP6_9BACT|nr:MULTISPECIES: hypothetical protein [Pirellulaceae]PQO29552.1 hypothetical protein C5Y83_26190 [Blastopirellula marina]RCS42856.1 hypothetical protein DTL21_26235 [Bremerella cremea]